MSKATFLNQSVRPVAAIVTLVLAAPLLVVVAYAFLPADAAWQHLSETVLDQYLLNTFLLVVLVGTLAASIGVASAWLVASCEFPGRRLLAWLLVLPLAAPAYVVAYAYTDLLDVSGPLQSALRGLTGSDVSTLAFSGVRSLPGAAVMLAVVLYPYVYLLCRNSFSTASRLHFDAARVLGRSPTSAFFGVALPAARPAIASGTALVLMETLADFGVVQHFSVPTLSTGIYRSWIGLGEHAAAMRLALVMLVFVVVLLAMESMGRRGQADVTAMDAPLRYELRGLRAIAATLVCALPVAVGFGIPVLLLAWYQFGGNDSGDSQVWSNTANSLQVSVIAALVCTGLALLFAAAQRQSGGLMTRLFVRLGTLGYAIPGTLLAVGALSAFSLVDVSLTRWLRDTFSYSGGLILSGTTVLLVYGYVCRFTTVSYNSVHAGMSQLSPTLDAVARTLGEDQRGVVRRVHLPMLRPSLVTAGLLVFVDAMRELPASLMLRPFNFDTLSTRVYWLASDERLAEASGAALLIVAIGIIPVILANRLAARTR